MPKAAKPKLRTRDREDDLGPPEASSRPLSEITGRHDEGSGANETVDGLDEYQEAARHGAEDIPAAEKRKTLKDVPVFDRADTEPKI
jgi:hypothetical protein